MLKLFKYIFSVLIILLLLPILILQLPIYAFRVFVAKFVIRFYPKVDKILTTRSSNFGADAIYQNPKCSLLAVYILDGTMSLDHLRQMFQTRVIHSQDVNGRFKKPEFQQYVTKLWGFFFWKWEDQFDINNHIQMYNGKFKEEFLNGTKPVNAEAVSEVLDELLYQPFRSKTSPWKIYLIHNYQETDSVGSICTAFIFHLHHCLGDGFSITKTLDGDMAQLKTLDRAKPNSLRPWTKICRSVDFFLSAPYDLVSQSLSSIDVNSLHIPEKDLKRITHSAISVPVPMNYLKEIKNEHKVTFTSLILECFTAATRKLMMEAGFTVPDTIHITSPLPAPGHPDKMRNHMAGCFIALPVGLSDSKKRLVSIEKSFARAKNSAFPMGAFKMSMVLNGGLFSWMIPALTYNFITTAIMSNFAGSSTLLSWDEHKVVDMWFTAGPLSGNCGIGFTSLSYNGSLRLVVGIDEGIVPKNQFPAKQLIQYFLEEVEVLRKEALV